MATDTEIEEILSDLADAYTDWRPGNITLTFGQYKNSLRQYSKDLLQRAARRCMDSCLFFPKIAEIRKAIAELPSEHINVQNAPSGPFVPPPPEFYEAMNKLFAKWGIQRKPRYHGLPKLPDVSPRMPYADD